MENNLSFRISANAMCALFTDKSEIINGARFPSVAFNWSINQISRTDILDLTDSECANKVRHWEQVCLTCDVSPIILVCFSELDELANCLANLEQSEAIVRCIEDLDDDDLGLSGYAPLTLRDKVLFPDRPVVEAYMQLAYSYSHDIWDLGTNESFWIAYGRAITAWAARIKEYPADYIAFTECFPGIDAIDIELEREVVPMNYIDSLTVDREGKTISFGGPGSRSCGGFDNASEVRVLRDLPFIFDVVDPTGHIHQMGRFPEHRLDLGTASQWSWLKRKHQWVKDALTPAAKGVFGFTSTDNDFRIDLIPPYISRLFQIDAGAHAKLTCGHQSGVEIKIEGLADSLVGKECTVRLLGFVTENGLPIEKASLIEKNLPYGGCLKVKFDRIAGDGATINCTEQSVGVAVVSGGGVLEFLPKVPHVA